MLLYRARNTFSKRFLCTPPPELIITETAKKRLRVLGEKQNYLRITVDAGGCSGFVIKFTIDNTELQEEDKAFEDAGGKVVIDDVSLDLIKGATVDYQADIARQAFVVLQNPKAKSSCGCNVSFSTE